jgi:hypothetical protein
MPKDSYEVWLAALRKKLAAAVAEANPLVEQERYDDAEAVVRKVETDIYSAIAIGNMYKEYLKQLVASGRHRTERARAEEVFRRGLRWAQSAYPEPHTQIEADSYSTGQAEDLVEFVKILGYQPGQK